jgi:hypothetical protein
MAYRLAQNVQVRKEKWGLLFYSPTKHRIFFVRSLDYLYPHYFDGTWNLEGVIQDISRRTGASISLIEGNIRKSIENLLKVGMVVNELC